ncbi:uncharacterized protein MONBRDRAFT_16219, partial [Monosiga brevicollis MX1]
GALNCLGGLKFVITGVLESLEREDVQELVKDHGGVIQKSVSKRVDYVVAGDEPGPSKMSKARDLKLKVLDEDGLFELIRTRPAQAFGLLPCTPCTRTSLIAPHEWPGLITFISPTTLFWHTEEPKSAAKKASPAKKVTGSKAAPTKPVSSGASSWRPWFQAVLMVGPPGVGKTTTATVVCRECGYEPIELNASDVRNRGLLHEKIGALTGNKTMTQFYQQGQQAVVKKTALIFDEVDGMAGNEDRGGVGEIIKLINTTKMPIICIANDIPRKLMTLKGKCYNLRFSRPRAQQVVGAMMTVAHREGLKVNPIIVQQMVEAADGDMRQVLNNMYLFSRDDPDLVAQADKVKANAKAAHKNIAQNTFDVIHKFFKGRERPNIYELTDAFFVDYSIMPLFVQENYLKHKDSDVSTVEHLTRLSQAADAISESDLLSTVMMSQSNYKALPVLAVQSCIRPGYLSRGSFQGEFRPPYGGGQYTFPSWLGKYSSQSKFKRYTSELQQHMRMAISADSRDVRLAYVPYLRQRLNKPLADASRLCLAITLSFVFNTSHAWLSP